MKNRSNRKKAPKGTLDHTHRDMYINGSTVYSRTDRNQSGRNDVEAIQLKHRQSRYVRTRRGLKKKLETSFEQGIKDKHASLQI